MNPQGQQSLTLYCKQCQNNTKNIKLRHLHESTLTLGETEPSYTTTHSQSYSGRLADGRPLLFQLRDPSFPSQHRSRLDFSSNMPPLQSPLLSHTKDVHGPKHITMRTDPTIENWVRYRSGQAVRDITNPQDSSDYWTTNQMAHMQPVNNDSTQQTCGRPTPRHEHNILTGEQKQTAGPRSSRRPPRDKQLWPVQRWETDCTAYRLY